MKALIVSLALVLSAVAQANPAQQGAAPTTAPAAKVEKAMQKPVDAATAAKTQVTEATNTATTEATKTAEDVKKAAQKATGTKKN